MKSVGNLNDFVRQHMLEPFDASARIDAVVGHFDDLTKAHDAVIRAQGPARAARPAAGRVRRVRRRRRRRRRSIGRSRTGSTITWRPAPPSSSSSSSTGWTETWCSSRRSSPQPPGSTGTCRTVATSWRWSGPGSAATGWRRWRPSCASRSSSGRSVGPPPPATTCCPQQPICLRCGSAAALPARRAQVGEHAARAAAEDADLSNARIEHEVRLRALRTALGGARRRGPQPAEPALQPPESFARHPRRLCSDLGLDEDALPFAGELIAGRARSHATGRAPPSACCTASRCRCSFPRRTTPRLPAWVDRTTLGARLVYFRVPEPRASPRRGRRRPAARRPSRSVRPTHRSPTWVEARARSQRAGHAAASTRRPSSAATAGGDPARPDQGPAGRHEKDDRSRIDDRSRYVLGWANEARRGAARPRRAACSGPARGRGRDRRCRRSRPEAASASGRAPWRRSPSTRPDDARLAGGGRGDEQAAAPRSLALEAAADALSARSTRRAEEVEPTGIEQLEARRQRRAGEAAAHWRQGPAGRDLETLPTRRLPVGRSAQPRSRRHSDERDWAHRRGGSGDGRAARAYRELGGRRPSTPGPRGGQQGCVSRWRTSARRTRRRPARSTPRSRPRASTGELHRPARAGRPAPLRGGLQAPAQQNAIREIAGFKAAAGARRRT